MLYIKYSCYLYYIIDIVFFIEKYSTNEKIHHD